MTGLAATPFGALISRGEGTYNSVNRGAAGGYRSGTEDLANKTVAEVMTDQANQKYNAAGRYQIIKDTLRAAVKSMGLTGNEKFDQKLQDRIFGEFLAGTKRPGIAAYLTGKSNDIHAALKQASEEWASVADPDTGLSHYAGQGNNRASIGVAEMTRALEETRKRTIATAAKPAPGSPPVTVPAQRPVNGAVDVSITHKNAPPNSAVTASGSGSVNVAPVRVEHQDMADI